MKGFCNSFEITKNSLEYEIQKVINSNYKILVMTSTLCPRRGEEVEWVSDNILDYSRCSA